MEGRRTVGFSAFFPLCSESTRTNFETGLSMRNSSCYVKWDVSSKVPNRASLRSAIRGKNLAFSPAFKRNKIPATDDGKTIRPSSYSACPTKLQSKSIQKGSTERTLGGTIRTNYYQIQLERRQKKRIDVMGQNFQDGHCHARRSAKQTTMA